MDPNNAIDVCGWLVDSGQVTRPRFDQDESQEPTPPPCDCCVSCGAELSRVFDDYPSKQYDNALEVSLSGGYGMFFDNIDGDHHVFLCHDCAHLACINLPWLAQLIQPEH